MPAEMSSGDKVVGTKPQAVQDVDCAKAIQATCNDTALRVSRAIESIAQAKLYLEDGAGMFRKSWLEWTDETKHYLEDVRGWRMAMTSETVQAMRALNDVREFLGKPDFRESMAQVRELVDLGERVARLKQSGVLDTLVDTLLKVEAHGKAG